MYQISSYAIKDHLLHLLLTISSILHTVMLSLELCTVVMEIINNMLSSHDLTACH